MVAARIPKARILIVPTHIDECANQEIIDLKCRNILTNIKEQQEEMVSRIDEKIRHIKKQEGYCMPVELDRILEHHRKQKDNLPVISLQYKVCSCYRYWDKLYRGQLLKNLSCSTPNHLFYGLLVSRAFKTVF